MQKTFLKDDQEEKQPGEKQKAKGERRRMVGS